MVRNLAFGWLGLFALSMIAASDDAWTQDDPNCWAEKRRTDLRSGEVRFECMQEPESWRNIVRLRQLADLGIQDQKDIAFVLEKLEGDDWDLRAEAARALRLSHYTKAIPQLVASVSPKDWRLTFEVMVALNEFEAPQADAVLKDIANTYWLPAISEVARDLTAGRSLSIISLQTSLWVPLDYCRRPTESSRCPVLRDHPSLMGARRAPLVLEIKGGKLVGTDHGEWGGELGFIDEKATQTIIDENVLAIVQRGSRIFAVTGLDHGGLNRGYIWEVMQSDDGRWTARRLWRLPGMPYEVVAAPDGTIGLFGQFGSVLYRTDDTLQWLGEETP
jgi:hypothetical protein